MKGLRGMPGARPRLAYFVAALAAAASLGSAGAQNAVTYPARNIQIVVPYTPGTGADILSRLFGPKLAERWKIGVITDNRAGAAGNIGAEFVARAAPDGHTLLFTATARFFRDGWFYPGDIGRVSPHGFLFIDTRADDMLNVEGLKVMPGESEGVLAAHPAVAEAAVFRTASASGEEFLVAAVVKREEVDDKALLEYCREKLGARSPHRVVSVRELTRDAMGRVLRSELVTKIKSRGAK